jgi:hypothetical protein
MRLKLAATAAIALTAMPMAAFADGEVNIYSYRQAYLLEPLLNAFEKDPTWYSPSKAWPSAWTAKVVIALPTW